MLAHNLIRISILIFGRETTVNVFSYAENCDCQDLVVVFQTVFNQTICFCQIDFEEEWVHTCVKGLVFILSNTVRMAVLLVGRWTACSLGRMRGCSAVTHRTTFSGQLFFRDAYCSILPLCLKTHSNRVHGIVIVIVMLIFCEPHCAWFLT